jgi:hypothetical protein
MTDISPHQGQMLAKALGNVLVATGLIRPGTPMTGPELIHAAEDFALGFDGRFFRHEDAGESFSRWYSLWAEKCGLNLDPDHPEHHYDFRAAWMAGAKPDDQNHWPSQFKREGHPNRFVVENVVIHDTTTGKEYLLRPNAREA